MLHDDYYSTGMDYLAENEEEEKTLARMREEEEIYHEKMNEEHEKWITERYKSGPIKYVYAVLEDMYWYLRFKIEDFYTSQIKRW